MKTQAIKKDGHYYIPYLEGLELDADEVTIEIDDNRINQLISQKSDTRQDLERLNKAEGGNKLIESVIEGMPESIDRSAQSNELYSDEYIEKNWKELVSKGLSSCNDEYYKSEQYKLDRGSYLMEKYK